MYLLSMYVTHLEKKNHENTPLGGLVHTPSPIPLPAPSPEKSVGDPPKKTIGIHSARSRFIDVLNAIANSPFSL